MVSIYSCLPVVPTTLRLTFYVSTCIYLSTYM